MRYLIWAILLKEEKLEERLQILQDKAIDKVPEKHKKKLGIYFRQLHQASAHSPPQQYYMEEFFLLYKQFF